MHPIVIYCVWAVQEWAWNVYPSTNTSSSVVVACLAMQVLGVWWGSRNDFLEAVRPLQSSYYGQTIDGPKVDEKPIYS